MRRSFIAGATAVLVLSTSATAMLGASRKPGLWEYKTRTTWQKAPSAPGRTPADLGGEHTRQVCLTEEMIDQYGFLLPQSRGQCSIENKQVVPGRITADYVCNGRMTGKGALTSEWSDPDHVTGTIHFAGTLLVGDETEAVEWTTESKAEFKSSDCGAVRPATPPAGRR